MQTRRRLLKNAVSNLARGGASSVVALVLPAVLIRHMDQLTYGVWVLVLQVAGYLAYLDFGLQTAVGRYVAYANEKKDADQRDSIISTAFAGLSGAALLGAVVLVVVAVAAQHIFPQLPARLVPMMRIALLLVGFSLAIGLPASAFNGVFVGLERNEIPALIIGVGKLVTALGIVVAVLLGHSIVWMAAITAAVNLVTYALAFLTMRRVSPEIRLRRSLVSQSSARKLVGYCLSLTVWAFAMMLVTGLDLVFVGRFQFKMVAVYGVASALVAFIAGAQTAIFSAMMPHAAAIHAQEDAGRLGRLVLRSTQLGSLLLIVTAMPLLLFAGRLLQVWLGAQYAIEGARILVVLLVANMIRLVAVPYSVVLIGTGQQRLVIVTPLIEGFTNLFVSIVLGLRLGAIGVAYGTLIGACIGVVANIFYNIPRTRTYIHLTPKLYTGNGILFPAIASLPFIILRFLLGESPRVCVFACLLLMIGGTSLLWRIAVRSVE